MPSVIQSPEVDTTLPGATRRRVWCEPALLSHSLIALTLTKLYFSAGAANANTAQAVENGANLDETFGPLATVIELSTIRRLKLELLTNTVVIEYRLAKRTVNRVTVQCANHEVADEICTKIWRRLGGTFQVRSNRRDSWEIARGPLLIIAFILVCTAVLALLANLVADNAIEGHNWLRPWVGFDWKTICGVGGGLLAIAQVVLYRRLTKPPTVIEWVPQTEPDRAQRR